MRCQPGDLAITTHPSLTVLVSVLYRAQDHDFILPDGQKALRETAPHVAWVCEAMGAPFPVTRWKDGTPTQALGRYAVIADRWLRPIRDNPGTDETLTDVFKPAPVEV